MNTNTQKRLQHIGGQIPKKLLDKLVVQERDPEREIVEEAINNPRISEQGRKRLRAALSAGAYDRPISRQVDPEVSAELDRFVGKRVKEEMRAGRIKKADRNDPFIKAQQRRMKQR